MRSFFTTSVIFYVIAVGLCLIK